jgi:hypothetical protein
MAVLKAYFKKLGCEDAYVKDPDGQVRYHMEKDNRFTLLFKYKSSDKFNKHDRSKVPMSELEEYDKQ